MKKLLLLSLSLLCFTAIAQRKIEHHKHFVIKEWEEVRQSGDTIIYISPKIIRGYDKPRSEAFFFKHPEKVEYLEEAGILIVYNEISSGPPYSPLVIDEQDENGSKTVVNFKEETNVKYLGPDYR